MVKPVFQAEHRQQLNRTRARCMAVDTRHIHHHLDIFARG